jgi:hypothetical protein
VFVPFLRSWIKQGHKVAGVGVNGGYVGSLKPIAIKARQSEIIGYCKAAVFLGNDMIGFASEERVGL